MEQISFLLGAGFSVPAGSPVVKTISEYFIRRPLFDKVYHYSSSEWKWIEFGTNPFIEGAPFSNSHVIISCFVEQLIESYIESTKIPVLNYENFYEWTIKTLNESEELKKM